jgi:hypothetical protein
MLTNYASPCHLRKTLVNAWHLKKLA